MEKFTPLPPAVTALTNSNSASGLGNLTRQKMFGQFCNFSFKNLILPLAWLDRRPAAASPSSSQTQGSSSARAVMENGKTKFLMWIDHSLTASLMISCWFHSLIIQNLQIFLFLLACGPAPCKSLRMTVPLICQRIKSITSNEQREI